MRALFSNNEIYKPLLLNSQAQGLSGQNEQPVYMYIAWGPQRRESQRSCNGCIGFRPTLTLPRPQQPALNRPLITVQFNQENILI